MPPAIPLTESVFHQRFTTSRLVALGAGWALTDKKPSSLTRQSESTSVDSSDSSVASSSSSSSINRGLLHKLKSTSAQQIAATQQQTSFHDTASNTGAQQNTLRNSLRSSLRSDIFVIGQRAADPASRPVTPADRWHLGSVTKSITATLAAVVVEMGKLHWNSTVGEILTHFTMHPAYRTATVLQLLSHRSGLPANIPMEDLNTFSGDPLTTAQTLKERARMAAIALAMEPVGPADTFTGYSNNGFVVAAHMIEIVLNDSWEVRSSTTYINA